MGICCIWAIVSILVRACTKFVCEMTSAGRYNDTLSAGRFNLTHIFTSRACRLA